MGSSPGILWDVWCCGYGMLWDEDTVSYGMHLAVGCCGMLWDIRCCGLLWDAVVCGCSRLRNYVGCEMPWATG